MLQTCFRDAAAASGHEARSCTWMVGTRSPTLTCFSYAEPVCMLLRRKLASNCSSSEPAGAERPRRTAVRGSLIMYGWHLPPPESLTAAVQDCPKGEKRTGATRCNFTRFNDLHGHVVRNAADFPSSCVTVVHDLHQAQGGSPLHGTCPLTVFRSALVPRLIKAK